VVVTFVIVVTHLAFWNFNNRAFGFFNGASLFFDAASRFLVKSTAVDVDFDSGLVWACGALVVYFTELEVLFLSICRLGLAVVRDVDITSTSPIEIFVFVRRIGTSTVFTFSDIELRFKGFSVFIVVVPADINQKLSHDPCPMNFLLVRELSLTRGMFLNREHDNIPFTGQLYFGISVSGTFFVHRDVFVAAGGSISVDVNVDLFLSVCSGSWELPFKSSIFPSDARSTC
jgi:hypothetical protein